MRFLAQILNPCYACGMIQVIQCTQRAFLLPGILLLLLACSLPPDNTIRNEFYPGSPNYSVFSGDGYKGFRIFNAEFIIGYMLSIPLDDGTVYLKIDTGCILETAILHTKDGSGVRKFPVYQADWGLSLQRLAERENLRPMLTHFITNQYQRDMEPARRGSVFSLF